MTRITRTISELQFDKIINTYLHYDIAGTEKQVMRLSKIKRAELYIYCKKNYKNWGGMYSFFFNLIES